MTVGVTGGIGAGKSTVCRTFEALGAFVIDADKVGHEALRDPDVAQDLVEAFGEEILNDAGEVVRRELGRRAFSSEECRHRLNAVVWPSINRRIRDRVAQVRAQPSGRTVVIDAAMMVEWGDPKAQCDVLVVVTAPQEIRKRRTVTRLGISEEEAEMRMAAQVPEADRARVADYVIRNERSVSELEAEAIRVWRQIHATGSSPAAQTSSA